MSINNTEFDIRIKDNFLNEEDYNKIKLYTKSIFWKPTSLSYSTNNPTHVWFTDDAPDEIT